MRFPSATRPAAFLATLLAIIAGCASTPAKRIEERKETFERYPPHVQANIRAGRVQLSYDEDMAWMALGSADETSVRIDDSGEVVVWYYTRSRPGVAFSVGGGSYGGGAGVTLAQGAETNYRIIVEFRDGLVSYVEYFD